MSDGSERCDRYVLLGGGLAVPVEPLFLLLDLEDRGLHVSRDGDVLVVRPGGQLTDMDCIAIQRWKPHLLTLVSYRVPAVQ